LNSAGHTPPRGPAAAPAVDPGSGRQGEFAAFDDPAFQRGWIESREDGRFRAAIVIDGITCPACAWRNEQRLLSLPGVDRAEVNFSNHRATVSWDPAVIRTSAILAAIASLGYDPHPYAPSRHALLIDAERDLLLRHLAVAAALGMQVMLLAFAVYAGADGAFGEFFRWLMLALTAPVVAYSARSFYGPAWRDLIRRRLGMDAPVSLAILIAFAASVAATLAGAGAVYFDSVVMFVSFLLGGRYLELAARRRTAATADALVRLAPVLARRVVDGGRLEPVHPDELRPGERVMVAPGEAVPADGEIVAGESDLDEALLTGEGMPRHRRVGGQVLGGSTNLTQPLEVLITRAGAHSTLARIIALLDRAASSRPAITRLADGIAGWFIAAVMLIATVVGAYWYRSGNAGWLAVVISVLVVSCPCALSLATPAAITAATNALMRRGLLVVRADAIEALARVTEVVFDKTGTLTTGALRVQSVVPLGTRPADACLALAAALERWSEHPIGRAIVEAGGGEPPPASEVEVRPGQGVSGLIEGTRYFIGSPRFIEAATGLRAGGDEAGDARTGVVLATEREALCRIGLVDELRAGAPAAIESLAARGRRVALMSGDQPQVTERIGRQLGIAQVHAGMTPERKLEAVATLQREGAVVAMIGDGINDAPVLAAAQVSIAMGSGTDLARTTADCVLLGDDPRVIAQAIRISDRTLAVMRQNVAWAIGYNALALPAAAAGWIAPWMAAIGMSLSSLLVVLNALRLARLRD
jgi:Cu2+-exporting ATPase